MANIWNSFIKLKFEIKYKNILIKNNCDFQIHTLNNGGYKK